MKDIEKALNFAKEKMINDINSISIENIESITKTFRGIIQSTKAGIITALYSIVSKKGNEIVFNKTMFFKDSIGKTIRPIRIHIGDELNENENTIYLEYSYDNEGIYDDNLFVFNIQELYNIGKIIDKN